MDAEDDSYDDDDAPSAAALKSASLKILKRSDKLGGKVPDAKPKPALKKGLESGAGGAGAASAGNVARGTGARAARVQGSSPPPRGGLGGQRKSCVASAPSLGGGAAPKKVTTGAERDSSRDSGRLLSADRSSQRWRSSSREIQIED